MRVNRPYVFELARQLLAAQPADDLAAHYAHAERNGIDQATLDRAAYTLQRLAPDNLDEWIRWEYLVDGWLHGYLDPAADPAHPSLTTWRLGQLAHAHYLSR